MRRPDRAGGLPGVKRIIRVFPRRTNATPDDALAVVGRAPELWDNADKVLISVAFDADRQKAEELAEKWAVVAPVEIGGPAYHERTPAGEFEPGMFLKRGYTITSRGCPNRCHFCKVPEREGSLRLLDIKDGWNVLDNNLLACPQEHQRKVFDMLQRQPHAPRFTGGIEACRVTPWHAEWFAKLKPESLWMAYDCPADYEPLRHACKTLYDVGMIAPHRSKRVGAYVLMGERGDTPADARKRLERVIALGIKTQAMLFDNGRECRADDMPEWWDLRRKFTDAREVGAMVAETWAVPEDCADDGGETNGQNAKHEGQA